jgi:hypothetical protein
VLPGNDALRFDIRCKEVDALLSDSGRGTLYASPASPPSSAARTTRPGQTQRRSRKPDSPGAAVRLLGRRRRRSPTISSRGRPAFHL